MFLDLLQQLDVVDEREDVPHRARQVNDVLVAIFLVYEHLCELSAMINESTKRQG